MSYRSFKKLLGETSLERKCRFLLGGFILLLISGSFWLYARQTEDLAYDQTISLCRLLVQNVIDEKLATVCAQGNSPTQSTFVDELLAEYSQNWHQTWPKAIRESRINIYRPGSKLPEKLPEDALSQERMREFLANPKMMEDNRLMLNRSINRYYGAIQSKSKPPPPQSRRFHSRTIDRMWSSSSSCCSNRSGTCQQTSGFQSIGRSPSCVAAT